MTKMPLTECFGNITWIYQYPRIINFTGNKTLPRSFNERVPALARHFKIG